MSFIFSLVAFLFLALPAMASSATWQSQLQESVTALQTGAVTAVDKVNVVDNDGVWRATLPALTIKDADGLNWQIPPIILLRKANGAATTITLPASVQQKNSGGKTTGLLTIGKQNLSGNWSDKLGQFQTLQGQLSQLAMHQDANQAQASIEMLTLNGTDGKDLIIGVKNSRASSVVEGKNFAVQIGQVDYKLQYKTAQGLGIAQLVALLRHNAALLAKAPVTMTIAGKTLSYQEGGKATLIDSVAATLDITPLGDGKTATLRDHVTLNGLAHNPAKFGDMLMPRNVETTGGATPVPLSVLASLAGGDADSWKSQLAAAHTVVTFDSIKMVTGQGARLDGNGTLTANAAVPSGFTGTLTFKSDNLGATMAAQQQQMQNGGANLQAVMGYALLQGLGTQQGTATQYVLTLTPQGQIMLNGNDVSGLMRMGGMGGKSPAAMPVVPVQSDSLPPVGR